MAAFSPRERDAFMKHWGSILQDASGVHRTIELDGTVAGFVLLFWFEGKREVGYWVGREFWGRGIATRALAALLDEVPERPIYAGVAETNVASIRVLEKCGFTVAEATAEEHAGEVMMLLE